MKYMHTTIHKVKGIALPSNGGDMELVVDDKRGMRAVLTNQPDDLAIEGDRKLVVAGLLLGGIVGSPNPIDKEAIATGLGQLRESRRQNPGGCSFLVVSITGEVEDFTSPHQREFDDFVVTFHGPSKESIRENSEVLTTAIISAMTLASESIIGLKKVSNAVTFFRDDRKPVYVYTASSGNISPYVSRPIATEEAAFIKTWYPKLVGNSALERVIWLLTTSFKSEGDKLRSFLATWTALEIFVNKTFAQYEAQLYQSLNQESHPAAHRQYLERIRNVMKDKYRLRDKFAVIACQLSPIDADEDVKMFKEAKDIRDALSHGQDVTESSFPVSSVQNLVRKYLRFHLH